MTKIYIKDNLESILHKLYTYICREKTIYHLSLGYLASVFVDFVKQLSNTGFKQILISKLSLHNRNENLITYVAIFIVLIFVILKKLLRHYFKNKTFDSRLRDIYTIKILIKYF